jgi:hypothetical protein
MMSVGTAVAKTPASRTPPNQAQNDHAQLGLDVTVVDPTGALLPNARVELCNCNERTRLPLRTDLTGVAHFAGLLKGSYELEVEAQGFKTSRTNVTLKKTEQIQIKLKIAPTTTTVVVNGQPAEVMGTVVGILTTTEHLPLPPVSSGMGHGTLH